MARLRISLKRQVAIQVDRITVGPLKLVYVLTTDKKQRYAKGRSKIVYIGTTKNGKDRIASSAAYRAEDIFSFNGVTRFEARIVTCTPRQRIRSWVKLERALLLAFKERYGAIPRCNTHGSRMKLTNEYEIFAKKRLTDILDDLA